MKRQASYSKSKLIFCIAFLVSACSGYPDRVNSEATGVGVDDNKSVARQFLELQGTPAIQTLLADDYMALRGEFQNLHFHAAGSELEEASSPLREAIVSRSNDIELVIAEGDRVAIKYKISATHGANLYGIPATGKTFDIEAVAIFTLSNSKVTNSWLMADEAGLLRQIGVAVPDREDSRREAAPLVVEGRQGDLLLAELLAAPVDSQAYRNKLVVNAYKSKNPPPGILPDRPGRPYDEWLRPGFRHVSERGAELGMNEKYPFLGAFPDRVDKIALLLSEGDNVMLQFRLTATNTNSLFGLPPTNGPVDAWEVAFMKFEGDRWRTAWWFGDDLSMSMQLNAPQAFLFPDD